MTKLDVHGITRVHVQVVSPVWPINGNNQVIGGKGDHTILYGYKSRDLSIGYE